jgi:hypothetical protein
MDGYIGWQMDVYLSYSLLTTLSTPRKTAVRIIAPMFIGSLKFRNKLFLGMIKDHFYNIHIILYYF